MTTRDSSVFLMSADTLLVRTVSHSQGHTCHTDPRNFRSVLEEFGEDGNVYGRDALCDSEFYLWRLMRDLIFLKYGQ